MTAACDLVIGSFLSDVCIGISSQPMGLLHHFQLCIVCWQGGSKLNVCVCSTALVMTIASHSTLVSVCVHIHIGGIHLPLQKTMLHSECSLSSISQLVENGHQSFSLGTYRSSWLSVHHLRYLLSIHHCQATKVRVLYRDQTSA